MVQGSRSAALHLNKKSKEKVQATVQVATLGLPQCHAFDAIVAFDCFRPLQRIDNTLTVRTTSRKNLKFCACAIVAQTTMFIGIHLQRKTKQIQQTSTPTHTHTHTDKHHCVRRMRGIARTRKSFAKRRHLEYKEQCEFNGIELTASAN